MKIALIAAVVHDVLKAEQFETFADLVETVKGRCARLKVPYDAGVVSEALQVVARTRPLLVRSPPVATPPRHRASVPLSRAEAAALWRTLCAALVRAQATGARNARV
jgi:hypothetical protein